MEKENLPLEENEIQEKPLDKNRQEEILRQIKNDIEFNENLPTSDKKENVFTQNINMPIEKHEMMHDESPSPEDKEKEVIFHDCMSNKDDEDEQIQAEEDDDVLSDNSDNSDDDDDQYKEKAEDNNSC